MSSQIRRQIGLFNKQLQRHVSTSTTILKDYHVSPEARQFDHLDTDELETFRQEIHSVRKSLLNAYEKISKLHDEWTTLQQSVADESTNFIEYIEKYGDYRESIATAVNQLELLDHLLDDLDHELHKRNIDISCGSSESTSNDDHPVKTVPIYHGPITTQNAAIPQYNNSLLNFVDASILSKMELPTFDGNILEYPEFSSRFATLIGNKAELDNTTKFSLLKSCLRGPALNAIQGLSLISENYKIAMDILKTHYDDKVTIKHILYSRLADLLSI